MLFDLMTTDTTLLTANKRLSRFITQAYRDHQLKAEITHWESLTCLPWHTWLQQIFEQTLMNETIQPHQLLTLFQEQCVWEKIITQSKALDTAPFQIAKLAQDAFALLTAWAIPIQSQDFDIDHRFQSFFQWQLNFQHHCQQNHLLTTASLTRWLDLLFQQNQLPIPRHLMMIGFLEIEPATQSLLKTLQNKGCRVDYGRLQKTNQTAKRIALNDTREEILTMAKWAKALIEQNPSTTIACIIPNLNALKNMIQRTFAEIFHPHQPFNISLGTPLFDIPFIRFIFELLHWATTALSLAEISYLIRSPFWANASDRFEFEIPLYEAGKSDYTLAEFVLFIKSHFTDFSVWQPLLQYYEMSVQCSVEQSPHAWQQFFLNTLELFHWPNIEILDATQQIALEHWHAMLHAFAQLDSLIDSLSFEKALFYLKELCKQKMTQPASDGEKPIQILGLMESHGLTFSHTWVLGLNDHEYPPQPKPNPLIPIVLQKTHHLPHASHDREYDFCRHFLSQLSSSADEIIFSYAHREQDRPLNPSALIKSFPLIQLSDLPQAAFLSAAEKRFASQSLEIQPDNQAPSIQPHEAISGGTSILKLQATCPFLAFAEIRLKAKALPKPAVGLDAKQKGILLHNTLEIIWRQLKNQHQLLELSDDALTKLITESIKKSFAKHRSTCSVDPAFFDIEQERLEKIMTDWLRHEKTREPFLVAATEQWQSIEIGGLQLSVRLDRMDELADGSFALVDYKSGDPNISSWFGDRPDEPQLPLYAVTLEKPISVIAFAQIQPEKLAFKGIGKEANILPNVKAASAAWDIQLTLWRRILENLAQDFRQGKATVDPKESKSCRYCSLQSLCRIQIIHATSSNNTEESTH